MRKVVRVVWIGVLSGLAFLVAGCTQDGLSRRERKQLVKERDRVQKELVQCQNEIDTADYDALDIDEFMANKRNCCALEDRLDSINYRLGDSIDLEDNYRQRRIKMQMDSLMFIVEENVSSSLYGSPLF